MRPVGHNVYQLDDGKAVILRNEEEIAKHVGTAMVNGKSYSFYKEDGEISKDTTQSLEEAQGIKIKFNNDFSMTRQAAKVETRQAAFEKFSPETIEQNAEADGESFWESMTGAWTDGERRAESDWIDGQLYVNYNSLHNGGELHGDTFIPMGEDDRKALVLENEKLWARRHALQEILSEEWKHGTFTKEVFAALFDNVLPVFTFAAAGAGAGATIGSMVPGAGTLAGGIMGLGKGAIAGSLANMTVLTARVYASNYIAAVEAGFTHLGASGHAGKMAGAEWAGEALGTATLWLALKKLNVAGQLVAAITKGAGYTKTKALLGAGLKASLGEGIAEAGTAVMQNEISRRAGLNPRYEAAETLGDLVKLHAEDALHAGAIGAIVGTSIVVSVGGPMVLARARLKPGKEAQKITAEQVEAIMKVLDWKKSAIIAYRELQQAYADDPSTENAHRFKMGREALQRDIIEHAGAETDEEIQAAITEFAEEHGGDLSLDSEIIDVPEPETTEIDIPVPAEDGYLDELEQGVVDIIPLEGDGNNIRKLAKRGWVFKGGIGTFNGRNYRFGDGVLELVGEEDTTAGPSAPPTSTTGTDDGPVTVLPDTRKPGEPIPPDTETAGEEEESEPLTKEEIDNWTPGSINKPIVLDSDLDMTLRIKMGDHYGDMVLKSLDIKTAKGKWQFVKDYLTEKGFSEHEADFVASEMHPKGTPAKTQTPTPESTAGPSAPASTDTGETDSEATGDEETGGEATADDYGGVDPNLVNEVWNGVSARIPESEMQAKADESKTNDQKRLSAPVWTKERVTEVQGEYDKLDKEDEDAWDDFRDKWDITEDEESDDLEEVVWPLGDKYPRAFSNHTINPPEDGKWNINDEPMGIFYLDTEDGKIPLNAHEEVERVMAEKNGEYWASDTRAEWNVSNAAEQVLKQIHDLGIEGTTAHRARSGSIYIEFEGVDADGEEDNVSIRVADHKQVEGGGFQDDNDGGGTRSGESDYDIYWNGETEEMENMQGLPQFLHDRKPPESDTGGTPPESTAGPSAPPTSTEDTKGPTTPPNSTKGKDKPAKKTKAKKGEPVPDDPAETAARNYKEAVKLGKEESGEEIARKRLADGKAGRLSRGIIRGMFSMLGAIRKHYELYAVRELGRQTTIEVMQAVARIAQEDWAVPALLAEEEYFMNDAGGRGRKFKGAIYAVHRYAILETVLKAQRAGDAIPASSAEMQEILDGEDGDFNGRRYNKHRDAQGDRAPIVGEYYSEEAILNRMQDIKTIVQGFSNAAENVKAEENQELKDVIDKFTDLSGSELMERVFPEEEMKQKIKALLEDNKALLEEEKKSAKALRDSEPDDDIESLINQSVEGAQDWRTRLHAHAAKFGYGYSYVGRIIKKFERSWNFLTIADNGSDSDIMGGFVDDQLRRLTRRLLVKSGAEIINTFDVYSQEGDPSSRYDEESYPVGSMLVLEELMLPTLEAYLERVGYNLGELEAITGVWKAEEEEKNINEAVGNGITNDIVIMGEKTLGFDSLEQLLADGDILKISKHYERIRAKLRDQRLRPKLKLTQLWKKVSHRDRLKDIKPEALEVDILIKTFGFRNATLPKKMREGERRTEKDRIIRLAYNAFADLAEAMDRPYSEIGRNYALSLGAVGTGNAGGNNYTAFFGTITMADGTTQIGVHLNGNNGDGALAHEWFHSEEVPAARDKNPHTAAAAELLRDYLSTETANTKEIVEDALRAVIATMFSENSFEESPGRYDMSFEDGIGKKLAEAGIFQTDAQWKEVALLFFSEGGRGWSLGNQSTNAYLHTSRGAGDDGTVTVQTSQYREPSKFYEASLRAGRDFYWIKPEELAARGFEAALVSRLKHDSPFLVDKGRVESSSVYPQGEELERTNEIFRQWFANTSSAPTSNKKDQPNMTIRANIESFTTALKDKVGYLKNVDSQRQILADKFGIKLSEYSLTQEQEARADVLIELVKLARKYVEEDRLEELGLKKGDLFIIGDEKIPPDMTDRVGGGQGGGGGGGGSGQGGGAAPQSGTGASAPRGPGTGTGGGAPATQTTAGPSAPATQTTAGPSAPGTIPAGVSSAERQERVRGRLKALRDRARSDTRWFLDFWRDGSRQRPPKSESNIPNVRNQENQKRREDDHRRAALMLYQLSRMQARHVSSEAMQFIVTHVLSPVWTKPSQRFATSVAPEVMVSLWERIDTEDVRDVWQEISTNVDETEDIYRAVFSQNEPRLVKLYEDLNKILAKIPKGDEDSIRVLDNVMFSAYYLRETGKVNYENRHDRFGAKVNSAATFFNAGKIELDESSTKATKVDTIIATPPDRPKESDADGVVAREETDIKTDDGKREEVIVGARPDEVPDIDLTDILGPDGDYLTSGQQLSVKLIVQSLENGETFLLRSDMGTGKTRVMFAAIHIYQRRNPDKPGKFIFVAPSRTMMSKSSGFKYGVLDMDNLPQHLTASIRDALTKFRVENVYFASYDEMKTLQKAGEVFDFAFFDEAHTMSNPKSDTSREGTAMMQKTPGVLASGTPLEKESSLAPLIAQALDYELGEVLSIMGMRTAPKRTTIKTPKGERPIRAVVKSTFRRAGVSIAETNENIGLLINVLNEMGKGIRLFVTKQAEYLDLTLSRQVSGRILEKEYGEKLKIIEGGYTDGKGREIKKGAKEVEFSIDNLRRALARVEGSIPNNLLKRSKINHERKISEMYKISIAVKEGIKHLEANRQGNGKLVVFFTNVGGNDNVMNLGIKDKDGESPRERVHITGAGTPYLLKAAFEAEGYKVGNLWGDHNDADAFMNDKDMRVLLASDAKGAEGFNLDSRIKSQINLLINMTLNWSAAIGQQKEGRIGRMTTKSIAKYINLFVLGFNTEERVRQINAVKNEALKVMQDGREVFIVPQGSGADSKDASRVPGSRATSEEGRQDQYTKQEIREYAQALLHYFGITLNVINDPTLDQVEGYYTGTKDKNEVTINTAFIFAKVNEPRERRVLQVIAHEVFGHKGIRKLLGGKLPNMAIQAAKDASIEGSRYHDIYNEVKVTYGFNRGTEQSQLLAIGLEMFGRIAEMDDTLLTDDYAGLTGLLKEWYAAHIGKAEKGDIEELLRRASGKMHRHASFSADGVKRVMSAWRRALSVNRGLDKSLRGMLEERESLPMTYQAVNLHNKAKSWMDGVNVNGRKMDAMTPELKRAAGAVIFGGTGSGLRLTPVRLEVAEQQVREILADYHTDETTIQGVLDALMDMRYEMWKTETHVGRTIIDVKMEALRNNSPTAMATDAYLLEKYPVFSGLIREFRELSGEFPIDRTLEQRDPKVVRKMMYKMEELRMVGEVSMYRTVGEFNEDAIDKLLETAEEEQLSETLLGLYRQLNTIYSNMGTYSPRQYWIFENYASWDKNKHKARWYNRDEAREAAVNAWTDVLLEEWADGLKEQPDEIQLGIKRESIEKGVGERIHNLEKLAEGLNTGKDRQSQTAKNNKLLEEREDYPLEVRLYLGEVNNPMEVAGIAITRNMDYVAYHAMQFRLAEMLINQGLAAEEWSMEYSEKWDTNDESSPLFGLYLKPFVAEAVSRFMGVPGKWDFAGLDGIGKLMYLVKKFFEAIKVIISPATHVLNHVGSIIWLYVNTAVSINKLLKSYQMAARMSLGNFGKLSDGDLEFLEGAVKYGVFGNSSRSETMGLYDKHLQKTLTQLNKQSNRTASRVSGFYDRLRLFYGLADQGPRLAMYGALIEAEIEDRENAEVSLEPTEAEKKRAATKTKRLMWSGNELSEVERSVNSFPFVGAYVGFWAGANRAAIHSVAERVNEFKEAKAKGTGYTKPAVRTASTIFLAYFLGSLVSWGLSDEDTDEYTQAELNKLLPFFFNQPGTKVIRVENGEIVIYPFGHAFINDLFMDAMMSAYEAARQGDGRPIEDFWARRSSSFKWSVFMGPLTEIAANKTESGRPIWNPEEPWEEFAYKITEHFIKESLPSSYRNGWNQKDILAFMFGSPAGIRVDPYRMAAGKVTEWRYLRDDLYEEIALNAVADTDVNEIHRKATRLKASALDLYNSLLTAEMFRRNLVVKQQNNGSGLVEAPSDVYAEVNKQMNRGGMSKLALKALLLKHWKGQTLSSAPFIDDNHLARDLIERLMPVVELYIDADRGIPINNHDINELRMHIPKGPMITYYNDLVPSDTTDKEAMKTFATETVVALRKWYQEKQGY